MKREQLPAGIDPRYYVETAGRALQLLEVVAANGGPTPISQIVSELAWSKPAVYRLVRTLESRAALRQHEDGGYVIGPVMITLGQMALRATGLTEVARPHLEQLREQLGETVVLTVLDDAMVVYLLRLEADEVLIPRTRLGARLPAYCTATGHALLSGLEVDEVRRRLAGETFEPKGPNTLGTLDELIARLEDVRRQGYAINDEELALGHRSVAAPIRDHNGDVVAAVSVSVAAARVSRSALARAAVDQVLPAAERISEGLGARDLADSAA